MASSWPRPPDGRKVTRCPRWWEARCNATVIVEDTSHDDPRRRARALSRPEQEEPRDVREGREGAAPRRLEQLPHLRAVPDLHPARPGLEDVGRGRPRVHGLLHDLRGPHGGPRQPDHGGGPGQGRRGGHALRHAPRPGAQGRGAPLRALPPRADPLHELGLRVHDARAAPGPRLHRTEQGPEVRGGLPRRPRRGARVREAAAAQGRPRPASEAAARGPRDPRRLRRGHARRAVERPRERARDPAEERERGGGPHPGAGDDERGGDGAPGRLHPGAAPPLRRVRLPAHLRRGQDGGEARLGRGPGVVQGQAGHRLPGQGHRGRAAAGGLRGAARDHGRDRRLPLVPRGHLREQPPRHHRLPHRPRQGAGARVPSRRPGPSATRSRKATTRSSRSTATPGAR